MSVSPYSADQDEPADYWIHQGWAFHMCHLTSDYGAIDTSGPVPLRKAVPSIADTTKDTP